MSLYKDDCNPMKDKSLLPRLGRIHFWLCLLPGEFQDGSEVRHFKSVNVSSDAINHVILLPSCFLIEGKINCQGLAD